MTHTTVSASIEEMLASDGYVIKVADQEIQGPKKWLVFIFGPNHKAHNLKGLLDQYRGELEREDKPRLNIIVFQVMR